MPTIPTRVVRLTDPLPTVKQSNWNKLRLKKAKSPTVINYDRPPDIVILFLGANPTAATSLALAKEAKEIDWKLYGVPHRHRFRVQQSWAVEAREVPALIMRHEPTIVHFSGHGSRKGALVFEDRYGRAHEVNRAAIATIFKILRSVRCVVLNACYSKTQAAAIAKHIEVVIGMSGEIRNTSAIAFASDFYQALGFGKSVHEAFELAKNSIDLHSLPGSKRPQLHKRRGTNPRKLVFV